MCGMTKVVMVPTEWDMGRDSGMRDPLRDGNDGEDGEDGEGQRTWGVFPLFVLSVLSVLSVSQ